MRYLFLGEVSKAREASDGPLSLAALLIHGEVGEPEAQRRTAGDQQKPESASPKQMASSSLFGIAQRKARNSYFYTDKREKHQTGRTKRSLCKYKVRESCTLGKRIIVSVQQSSETSPSQKTANKMNYSGVQ